MTTLCPGCYGKVAGEQCPGCGESVWLDGKLALIEPLGKHHPNVFRGRLRDGEEVAVKVLDVSGLRDWRDHDRFRAQRDILERLAELPVPRALGDFERRGRVFHCQTLLRGAALGNRRPNAEIEKLARELLSLLGEIHARGIVHRDLKPEHLLIGDTVQLLDFGSARTTGDESVEPTMVGTPGFMAPEQLSGDARVESDLFAVGKILQSALGDRPAGGRLGRLIRRLVHPDWRKRPHSCPEALRLLESRRALQWAWLSVPLLFGGGLVGYQTMLQQTPPPAAIVDEPRHDDLETLARALFATWEETQNSHDFARYRDLYGAAFTGIKRGAEGKIRSLDRVGWLADREKMFDSSLRVAADDLTVLIEERRAKLVFLQHFRHGGYSDHGRKQIVVEQVDGVPQIITEEMLDSRPGWDDAEYRRRFPASGATCEVAFDPSDREYLVALSHFYDYTEALRAAGKARRRSVDVEIVWGDDFENLEAGYWVLAGATDDAEEARQIAARTHGRVIRVHPGKPGFPGVLRLTDEREVSTASQLVTVAGGIAYVVNSHEALAFVREGDHLREQFRVLVPGEVVPVRVAVRESHAYVLDERGHWSLISENGLIQTRSFDPESEGRVAVFGERRFEIEGEEVAYRLREDDVHRFPLGSPNAGLWRIGDDRLLLYRESRGVGSLYLFAVGDTPVRLTKVCGTVSGEQNGPAHITIGAVDVDTDRQGGFELWSSQWGFFEPSLVADPVCPKEDDCPPYENTHFDSDVSMFRRPKLEFNAETDCTCEPGC